MPTFDQIRQLYPSTKDLSDAQIVQKTAELTGMPMGDVADSFGYQMPKSDFGKEVQAGGSSYLSGLGHLGSAVGSAVGADSFADSARAFAERRTAAANVLQGSSNAPHSYQDVQFGDKDKGVLNYMGGLAAGALPYVGEQLGLTALDAVTGGATAPVHLASLMSKGTKVTEAGMGIAKSIRGGLVDALPMTGGALGQQYEQAGKYDLPSAAAAGAASAALGQGFGLGAVINRGGIPIASGVQSRMGRSLLAGATGAAEQGVAMAGMEATNIGARQAVDPTVSFSSEDSRNRMIEAAVGGATIGGTLGMAHGAASSYKGKGSTGTEVGDAIVDAGEGNRPALGYSPLAGTLYGHPDGSMSLGSDMAFRHTYGMPEPTDAAPPGAPPAAGAPPTVMSPAAQAGAAANAPRESKAPKGPAPASQDERKQMFDKYGAPEEQFPTSNGVPDKSKAPIGFNWDGKTYYTPEALTKALDKQVLLERDKSPIEHQAEAALSDTLDGHMGPKEIAKYDQLYKDAPTVEVVQQRIENELQEPMAKLAKEMAKGDDKANYKTVEKYQTEVDFYKKWLDNLKDKDDGKSENSAGQTDHAAQDSSGNRGSTQDAGRVEPGRTGSVEPGQQGQVGSAASTEAASGTQSTEAANAQGREQVRVRSEPENAKQILTPADKTRLAIKAQDLHQQVLDGGKLPTNLLRVIADHHADEGVRNDYAPFATKDKVQPKEGYASRLSDEAKEAELQRVADAEFSDATNGKRDEFLVTRHRANGTSAAKLADEWAGTNPGSKKLSRQRVQDILTDKAAEARRDAAYTRLGIGEADKAILEAHRARIEKEAIAEKEKATTVLDEAREGTGADAVDHDTKEGMGSISSSGGTQLNLNEKDSLGARFAAAKTDEERAAITAEAAAKEKKVQRAVAKEQKATEAPAEKAKPAAKQAVKPADAPAAPAKPAGLRVVKKGSEPVKPVESDEAYNARMLRLAAEDKAEKLKAYQEGKDGRAMEAAAKVWNKAPELHEVLPPEFPMFSELAPELQREAAKLNNKNSLSLKHMSDIFDRHALDLVEKEKDDARMEREIAERHAQEQRDRLADERGEDDTGDSHDDNRWLNQGREEVRKGIKNWDSLPTRVHEALYRLSDFVSGLDAGRKETTFEKGDIVYANPAAVEFMENMNRLGLLHQIDSVSAWNREPMPEHQFGYIDAQEDGTYRVVLNDYLLTDDSPWAHKTIIETLTHETGHAVDRVNYDGGGGIYSSQPEFSLRRAADDSIRGTGQVARELVALYKKGDSFWHEMLNYPLSKDYGYYEKELVQQELFAQAFSNFIDPKANEIIKAEAPLTYKFMQEVVEHAKSSEAVPTTSEETTAAAKDKFTVRDTSGSDQRGNPSEADSQRTTADASGQGSRIYRHGSKPINESPAERGERLQRESGVRPSSRGISGDEKVIDRAIAALPRHLQGPAESIMTTMGNLSRKAGFTTLFGHDLADLASTQYGMKHPKEFMNLVSQNSALKASLDETVQSIGAKYNKLSNADRLAAQAYLKDTTMSQLWGYEPSFINDGKPRTVDLATQERFRALPPAVREVIADVNRHGVDTNRMVTELITNNLHDMYEAKLEGKTTDERAVIEAERDRKIADINDQQLTGPYAPLMRFGNHLAVGKSRVYLDAEKLAEKTGNYSFLSALKQDPQHYSVERHDTEGQARMSAKEMERRYQDGDAYYQEKDAFGKENYTSAWNLMQQVKEHLMSNLEGEDRAAADKVGDLLRDMYVNTIAESSYRRSMLKRENVSGVKTDQMFRGFLARAGSTHHFIANLTNGEKVNRAMADMKGEVASADGMEQRAKRQEVHNEFVKRRIAMTNMAETPIQNNIMAFTGVHRLLTSPAHYLQYISQPLTMHMPLLAGRHGYFHAISEMGSAFRDVIKMVKGDSHDMSGLLKRGESGEREHAMFQHLIRNGLLGVGREAEFGNPKLFTDSIGSNLWNTGIQKLGKIPHTLETFNKMGSGLATYRASYAEGVRKGLSGAEAHTRAMDRTMADLRTSYGSYDAFNSPRLFQQGGVFKTLPAKVMSQFRKFQVIHMAMLGRLMHGAFKGESPELRAVAQKQLAFMAAHYAVFAGAMGIPASHLMIAAVHAAFNNPVVGAMGGDYNPEEDKEEWLRGLIGDKDMANLVLHGVPAFAGVDTSYTTGAGDIASLFREGTGDSSDPKKAYTDYVLASMGPFAGTVLPSMLGGAADIARGNYYRGLENLLPKGITNVMKAMDPDGYTNKKGDQLIGPDEYGTFERLVQGLGAPSMKVTESNRERNEVYKYESHFKDVQNQLKLEFTSARRSGDDTASIQERWMAMQQQQSKLGFQMTPLSTLMKAPSEQRKREQSIVGGVETTKRNRGFVTENAEN